MKNVTKWDVEIFTDVDVLIKESENNEVMPYCFGINMKKFDLANNDFDIEYMFSRGNLPDTNLDPYNPLYKNPDFAAWDRWFTSDAP